MEDANAMKRGSERFLSLALTATVALTVAQVTVGLVALWLFGFGVWDPGPNFAMAAMVGPLITVAGAVVVWELLDARRRSKLTSSGAGA